MAKGKSKIALQPKKGVCHFVFHSCLVEQRGKTLSLTIPAESLTWRGAKVDRRGHSAWTAPAPMPLAAKEIDIVCQGNAQARQDGAGYPKAHPLEGGLRIFFRGAAAFGRVLQGETAKLLVQAQVKSISGLPRGTSWNGYESIELNGKSVAPIDAPAPKASKEGGPVLADVGVGNGPHQPYP